MGRAHLYVLDLGPDEMHENDAAAQLSWLVAGRGVSISTPAQGKVNLTAQSRGLLKISVRGVAALNTINHLTLSTLYTAMPCEPGQPVAATKIVPLAVKSTFLKRAQRVRDRYGILMQARPFLPMPVGAVITGSGMASGRIADGFDTACPAWAKKADALCSVSLARSSCLRRSLSDVVRPAHIPW